MALPKEQEAFPDLRDPEAVADLIREGRKPTLFREAQIERGSLSMTGENAQVILFPYPTFEVSLEEARGISETIRAAEHVVWQETHE